MLKEDVLLKYKRCSYPNTLICKEKGDISVALCTCAPPDVLFSNQLKEDLNRIVDLQSFIDVSIEAQPQNNHQIFKGFVANIDLNQ